MSREYIEIVVEAPCCHSRRTCHDYYAAVYDIDQQKDIKYLHAVRCYRGERLVEKLKVSKEKSQRIIVYKNYRSFKGNIRIYIDYCPESLGEERCREIILRKFGYIHEYEEVIE